jgi:DNA-binding NarL/FixJ family response regulator
MKSLAEPTAASKQEELSPQEQKVLALVAEGQTNKEIASALRLSDKTVRNYLSNIFQKLQVSRRSQAAALYARRSK